MSKKEQTRKQSTKPKWYKSAALPWAVIIITAAIAGGYIAGWHTSQNYHNTVKVKAEALVADLKSQK